MSIRVLWNGSFFAHHSLAVVNREMVLALAGRDGLEMAIRSNEDPLGFAWDLERTAALMAREATGEERFDITVRHQWPLDVAPPRSGKWVLMQPWEYGSLPRAWYEPMRFTADEVWVYSTFNRQCYVDAGIPEDRVRVIPLGVQPELLGVPAPFPLQTKKRFKFLFVGGTIPRKGIDLLLEAYTRAFKRHDDVCLVIKDFGAKSFYRGQTYGAYIRELQRDPRAPEIEYIAEELAPEQLRDLYHACDCLVHPYRGEGFGLPIAEAMACGLPVIVPDQGGAADFCTPETAVLVPAQRVPVPHATAAEMNTIGRAWWVEVRLPELRAQMRAVYDDPAEFTGIASRGRTLVRERFTWQHAGGIAADALHGLASTATLPLHANARAQHDLRLQEGMRSWERKDLSGALRNFAAARARMESIDALFNIAAALVAGGDHHTGAEVTETLVQRAVTDGTEPALIAAASSLAAFCHVELGQTAEARSAIDTALRHDPANADAHALLATLAQRKPPAFVSADPPAIRWRAPLFNGSGYADEARNFILGLSELGWRGLHLDPLDEVKNTGVLDPDDFQRLRKLVDKDVRSDIEVQHYPVDAAVTPRARVSVLRTMFETDRISADWVYACNRFTEVWVPTEFNRETFASSGVVREKLRVIPGSLDLALYDAALHRPLELGTRRGFRFLSVFDWQLRKGWDVLLHAYFQEFGPREDVTLVLKPGKLHIRQSPGEYIEEFQAKHGYRATPAVELVERRLTTREMISLYLACDCFVLPTRGEGWGRPYMEAMALGIPTIGTRWSAHLAFMNDENSFLIDVEGLEPADGQGLSQFEGHLWARPSLASTRALMRRAFEQRAEARACGERARQDIRMRFGREMVARQLRDEIMRLAGSVA